MPYKDKQKAKEYAKEYRLKYKEKDKLYQKQYRADNTEATALYKAAWYQKKRFDKYGILREDFDLALKNCNNACSICLVAFSDTIRPYIDHCHTTGKIRGIICFHCNTGLGHFKDKEELLMKARDYLKNPPFKYNYSEEST